MGGLIGSVLGVVVVTVVAAWIVERRWPAGSYLGNSIWAAASVPVISFLLFVLLTAVTLVGGRGEHPADVGMPIFALVFFWFYAAAAGVIVGIPTALIAVKLMRSG